MERRKKAVILASISMQTFCGYYMIWSILKYILSVALGVPDP